MGHEGGVVARVKRRGLGILLAAATLAATSLAAEGLLRFTLFSGFAREHFGWKLRRAGLYTSVESGPEYWMLTAALSGPAAARPHPGFDARLGWLKQSIDPITLAHADEQRLAGRVPVLLFGDSYAECVLPPGDCWQDVLERSELGATHAILNYGVSGYGLGQIQILLESVLERRAFAVPPVVVVGILVDDDLDRCYLPLRIWPKPAYECAEEGLLLHGVEHEDAAAYLAQHPLRIRSYLWRLVARQTGIASDRTVLEWAGESDHVAEKRALAERILRRIEHDLSSRGLDHFYLLFHGRRALSAPDGYGWQEPFLLATLRALPAPYISSRRYIEADERLPGGDRDARFIADGPGANHYTAATNAVVFQALADGLAGRFEP